MGPTKINGLMLKRMIIGCANEINANKTIVDSLNVFPVPDGDTGTNMSMTAMAAAKEMEKTQDIDISVVSKIATDGSLRGARGNSGVILSQLFRGFSKGLEGLSEAGNKELARAAEKAVETAYKAVMKPQEGTILTVARACADSARKYAEETEDIEVLLSNIIKDGKKMLEKTPDMLPVLKQANVVDSGGKGLIFILEGAYKCLISGAEIKLDKMASAGAVDFSALKEISDEDITFGYCTEFFINTDEVKESDTAKFKAFLSNLGDSIVVVSTDDLIKVHVHTDHPGLILEKALKIGSLSGLKIDNMRLQHNHIIDFDAPMQNKGSVSAASLQQEVHDALNPKKAGFISVSSGKGIEDIFLSLGVSEIIEGGQTMNPSTDDILKAIDKIDSENIIVLPNNGNIILAAEQAAELCTDKKVFVVHSKTIPEGITAMVNFEPELDVEEAVEIMEESLETVYTCMVTYAVRDSAIGDKTIKKGDILGMANKDITVICSDINECAKGLIANSVKEDKDVITIYYGEDITEEKAEEVLTFAESKFPDMEVELEYGGQPLYYYIISVE